MARALKKILKKAKVAAEYGDPDFILALAKCYEKGIGTEADPEKARELYESVGDYANDEVMENLKELFSE